jgi:hypothetical protein
MFKDIKLSNIIKVPKSIQYNKCTLVKGYNKF